MRKFATVCFMLAIGALLAGYIVLPGISHQLADYFAQNYPPPGRMVSVGDHKLHIFCEGTGGPTVVIEPGLGSMWVSWHEVIQQSLVDGRVCIYDRAGYGWSEAGPMPRTAGQIADELRTLLENAGEKPPFVLAAHSFGGHVARIFADRYGALLAGVVLVDPSHEDMVEAPRAISWMPRFGTERLRRLYAGKASLEPWARLQPESYQNSVLTWSSPAQIEAEHSEIDSMALSQQEVRMTSFPPGIPLIVLTATLAGSSGSLEYRQQVAEMHQEIVDSTPLGQHVLAEKSSHPIHEMEPELVSQAIREVRFWPNDPPATGNTPTSNISQAH